MANVSVQETDNTEPHTLGYVTIALMFICVPAGVILAYIDRSKASLLLASHYNYLIGTFWKALLFYVISAVLSLVLIGLVGMFFVSIWYIARCIKSLVYLNRGRSIINPKTWTI